MARRYRRSSYRTRRVRRRLVRRRVSRGRLRYRGRVGRRSRPPTRRRFRRGYRRGVTRGLTGNRTLFTETISFLTRDRLWAGGNSSLGAHYRAVKFLLQPFAAYDTTSGSGGYPWAQAIYEYPTSALTGNGTLNIGTAEGLYSAVNLFKNVKCYRVRMRIEWMWSAQLQTDAGTSDNDIRMTMPNTSLYYYNAQRVTGHGRLESSSASLGNMMNMTVVPQFVYPDQLRSDTPQMERPYAELFDVKGLKRLKFTQNSNVRWLTWRPMSRISKIVSAWKVDQVARSWADVNLGNTPTYDTDFAPGAIALYSDMAHLISGTESGDTVLTQNNFKFTFYFDYVLSGRT